jgi:hypothetical protein
MMPSVFAVFRLITGSNLVGWPVGRLRAFQDLVDVHGSLAKKVDIYRGVGHQPAVLLGEPPRH